MVDESEKNTLMRTKWNILRNLECINDFIDANGVPVDDHMVLDDIKDSLKSLVNIKRLMEGEAESSAKAAARPVPSMA